jgi:hypothetical protein
MTSGGRHQPALRELPASVPELMAAVQGLLIHRDLTWMYDVPRTPAHDDTSNLRSVERILDRLLADGRPLTQARPPAERVGATCRDFTVLTVAALRAHGVPARARCGFGGYFPGDTMEDHWVAEYWAGRWLLADAQLDDRHRAEWGFEFDTADVPRDAFVVAGQAWRRCRSGADDPGRYGLTALNEFGDWWIAANLVRDVAALAERELLPWDVWGAMPEPEDEITPDLVALFDELAARTADPDTAATARAVHDRDERVRVPATVRNMSRGGQEEHLP